MLSVITVHAQTAFGLPEQSASPGYDPQALFAPGFSGDMHLATRSPNGAPSLSSWQNRANYVLSVRLDTVQNELEGSAVIHYTNNSPDSLKALWLYLDQQTYRADARSNSLTSLAAGGHTEGYHLSSVKVGQSGVITDADYVITDTRLQIRLKKALAPKGVVNLIGRSVCSYMSSPP